ncbi:MAG TPA: alpha-L-rhamnosidase C-terminal domain-containing protein [Trebonia sp.]|nr:alpha-L-rhamnosidase C-terminal domain-containing protein [Trebonia sp.]
MTWCAAVLLVAGSAAGAGLSAGSAHAADAPDTARAPAHLTINDLTQPLDVTGSPQFGWLPQDAAGDETQTAYRIVVRNGLTGAQVWDSGKVASSQEEYVPYQGPQLDGGGDYDWTVTTWNRQGQPSPSATASFGMGLSDSQWSGAQWIRRPTTGNDETIDYTLARNQFALGNGDITRAVVYLAAPMRWQLHVNGQVIDTQDDYQTAGENYYDAEDITTQARAAQRAGGSARNQLAIGVLYADWAVGEAHPEGPQPYPTTLAADAPAGATTITVSASTASTCQSAPTRSAEFCGANYDWYAGETLGFGTPSLPGTGGTGTGGTGTGTGGFTTDTIASISGDTVTLTRPLPADQPSGTSVTSENGPSGLLAKIVVDYAGGGEQTFVSNGSWMVTKDTAELNTSATVRSSQGAGDYVEYYSGQNAQGLAGWDQANYRYGQEWMPGVVMGTAPLPNPPDCGNYSEPTGHNVAPAPPGTATATPVLSTPCGFTNLIPLQAPVTYKIVHPVSVRTLPDGTVEADFGYAFVGVPVVRFPGATSAQQGNQVTLTGSYRLAGTVTTAAATAGATSITVNDTSSYPDFNGTGTAGTGKSGGGPGFAVGDPVTVDAPADGYGAGHPETDTITSITDNAGGTATVGLATPLKQSHAAGVWVQGSRAGTDTLDSQTTNLDFYYTQSGTPGETTGFYGPMGWRYLQIDDGTQSDGGRPLTKNDIWAVEQYNSASQVGSGADDPGVRNDGGPDIAADVPGYQDTATAWNPSSVFSGAPATGTDGTADVSTDDAATFTSSDSELNAVFSLLERSALFAGQQAYEDSPDRQEGQFTGDGTNESLAQMEDLDERALTREFIDNLIYSQQRWWIPGSPTAGSTWGEVNALYPDNNVSNGGMRDIPDYTEMFPELVWDYYLATGDKQTLAAAYPTMVNVAQYVADNTYGTGQAAGLVCQLASFSSSSSYQFGIIDWPATDRYNTVVLNSGVDTVVNMRAVEDDRALAGAAQVLGDTTAAQSYAQATNTLITGINDKLVGSSGYYADGMSVAGSAQDVAGNCSATSGDALIANYSQTDQTFAIVYGVAPSSAYPQLGAYIASQGMKQGPMDIGQLELALVEAGQPAALVRLLTNTAGDGPAKILAEGGTSMWEQWDPGCSAAGGQAGDNDSYDDTECTGAAISQNSSDSFSHGWGSVGVYPVTRGLLGITVTGVGASAVEVEPPASGLASASGTEYTERGPVTVSWHRASGTGGEVNLQVTVPDNVTSTVALPAGTRSYVTSGAGAPRYEGTQDGRALYAVGSGTTSFKPAG